jgi:O-antigen/teichoic acid export membrane protein
LILGFILFLILRHSTVGSLAWGYVLASTSAELVYVWMALSLLRKDRSSSRFTFRQIQFPAREVLAFAVPGVAAILAMAGIPSINILLLGHMRTMTDVAYYRTALPAAELNSVVLTCFTLLYLPCAARMFARMDLAGMNRFYWKTAAWMSVLTFPIFAVTFSLARPVAIFLYGPRYAASGPVLALLALGAYFNVLLGFNVQTLKVVQRLNYITVVSAIAVAADVVVSLFLIPRFGAIGAGAGAAISLIGYNVLLQVGLLPTTKFKIFDRQFLSIYVAIGVSTAALLLVEKLAPLNFVEELGLVACTSAILLAITKNKLDIGETFPELRRVPLMRLIVS